METSKEREKKEKREKLHEALPHVLFRPLAACLLPSPLGLSVPFLL